MKTFGRISLLFLLAATCFVGGAYVNSVYTKWFYPNRYENGSSEFSRYARQQNGKTAENTASGQSTDASVPEETVAKEFPAAALEQLCTDCDTRFVVMKYDMQHRTTAQEETDIPAKYMGMTRENMSEAIAQYVSAPPLSELNQGFVTAELVSFSPQRVVVRKSYQKESGEDTFIILSKENRVTVYKNDLQTIYLYTDILLEELPPEVQREVIEQKYVYSEEELYNFLESYSS